jgi:hypothetical protein
MMKKKYIRPATDMVASQLNEHLLTQSNDWADAKGNPGVWGGGGQVIENGKMQGNENLWDD